MALGKQKNEANTWLSGLLFPKLKLTQKRCISCVNLVLLSPKAETVFANKIVFQEKTLFCSVVFLQDTVVPMSKYVKYSIDLKLMNLCYVSLKSENIVYQ